MDVLEMRGIYLRVIIYVLFNLMLVKFILSYFPDGTSKLFQATILQQTFAISLVTMQAKQLLICLLVNLWCCYTWLCK